MTWTNMHMQLPAEDYLTTLSVSLTFTPFSHANVCLVSFRYTAANRHESTYDACMNNITALYSQSAKL